MSEVGMELASLVEPIPFNIIIMAAPATEK